MRVVVVFVTFIFVSVLSSPIKMFQSIPLKQPCQVFQVLLITVSTTHITLSHYVGSFVMPVCCGWLGFGVGLGLGRVCFAPLHFLILSQTNTSSSESQPNEVKVKPMRVKVQRQYQPFCVCVATSIVGYVGGRVCVFGVLDVCYQGFNPVSHNEAK